MSIATRRFMIPQPNSIKPLTENELNTWVPKPHLNKLDHGLHWGFNEFARHMSFTEFPDEQHPAKFAMNTLARNLRRGGKPRYDCKYITGAYLIMYQLRHCIMAYRTYDALLGRFKALRELNVYDVGSGAEAGLIGLKLAMANKGHFPKVTYHSVEPSNCMRTAGKIMLDALTVDPVEQLQHIQNDGSIADLPSDLGEGVVRIVTAFHLSLPWSDNRYNSRDSAIETLTHVLDKINPDVFLCTCHLRKLGSLQEAVGQHRKFQDFSAEHVAIPAVPRQPINSVSSRDIVGKYGLCAPDHQSFERLDNKRIKTPESAILYSGFRWKQGTRTQA